MNTRIEYLYRDSCNNKVWNAAIVRGEITKSQIRTILDCLLDGENFIPSFVGLPEKTMASLGFAYDSEIDTPFFELFEDSFTHVPQPATTEITLDALVQKFLSCRGEWTNLLIASPVEAHASYIAALSH